MADSNVISDFLAEGEQVDKLVADLDATGWEQPTPAPGWTVAHQVAHLAATFRLAGLAAANPEAFRQVASKLSPDFDANVRMAMAGDLAAPRDELLAHFRSELATSARALGALAPDAEVPWLVRPLNPGTLAAAGMMELFAHGQDIADGLGVAIERTDRIGHLVWFGTRVWDFGYLARGLEVPDVALRFEITAPSGTVWKFGPEDSPERITGNGEDFCLLITRRRNRADLDVLATGKVATAWLDIAQAYRGPAGEGRKPGQFAAA